MLVSCTWYNDIAQRALQVQSTKLTRTKSARIAHKAKLQHAATEALQHKHGTLSQRRKRVEDAASDSQDDQHGASNQVEHVESAPNQSTPYLSAAEEMYRMLVFVLLYVQIWLAGMIPYIGE